MFWHIKGVQEGSGTCNFFSNGYYGQVLCMWTGLVALGAGLRHDEFALILSSTVPLEATGLRRSSRSQRENQAFEEGLWAEPANSPQRLLFITLTHVGRRKSRCKLLQKYSMHLWALTCLNVPC